jgi:hypothetical protein
MAKLTLTNIENLQDTETAKTSINNNSAAIEVAMENTLSRDGTLPNQMGSTLDMNSNAIINLPAPISGSSPLRLTDASTLNGGGTIATFPTGGTTGQAVIKASNDDFDLTFGNIVSSVGVTMPAGITVVGSPITSSGTIAGSWTSGTTGSGANVFATSPTLVIPNIGTPSAGVLTNCTGLPLGSVTGLGANVGTFLTTPSSANLAAALTDETGTGANVFATSPTLVTPVLGTPTSGTLTNCTGLPIATGVSGLGTGVGTFLATPSSANLRTALTDETGTGGAVFATSPTITKPNIIGTTTTDAAAAGSIGEYIESILVAGSATALTTNVAKTVTSISLTAGDWDVTGHVAFGSAATTSFTIVAGSLSTVDNTTTSTLGRWNQTVSAAFVPNTIPVSTVFGPSRFSLGSTTTVYLVAFATFTVSTASAYGIIRARRIF